jgi:hypothetical protein
MRKPDTILDEIHSTRGRIDEKTKGMSASERTEYFNQQGKMYAQKYGFKVVTSSNSDSHRLLFN